MCTREWDFSVIRPKTTAAAAEDPRRCVGVRWRANKGLCISLLTKVTVDIEEEEPRRKQTKRPRGSVERRTDADRQWENRTHKHRARAESLTFQKVLPVSLRASKCIHGCI